VVYILLLLSDAQPTPLRIFAEVSQLGLRVLVYRGNADVKCGSLHRLVSSKVSL